MPRSKKTAIIEALFEKRWQGTKRPLTNPVVTLTQVEAAIRAHNKANPKQKLSTKNPANFFKDFVRKKKSANDNWPASVLKRGFSGKQVAGKGVCFEFVRMPPGQSEPFPAPAIRPRANVPIHRIQSASMPLASRRLGRRDEAWLIQVLSRLHVIETHLSLHSPRPYIQVDLLQTNVKLSGAEIDALFLALEKMSAVSETEPQTREVIVVCEAKGLSDDVLVDQIVSQVRAAFRMKALHQDIVLPMAAKAIGPSRIHITQFEPVNRVSAEEISSLKVESEAIYELVPSVPGVGK